MSSSKLFLLCSLLFTSVCSADGFMEYVVDECVFNSTELQDIEYIYSDYFNKKEQVRFSSSVGKFVGYTDVGLMYADEWNKDESLLANRRAQKEGYCKQHVDIYDPHILQKTAKPDVRLRAATPPAGGQVAMVMCSAYGFYPKKIKVSWQRNEQEVTSDVTATEELQDGDWFYQIHSDLEYTPRAGDVISCVVQHASLEEPLIVTWDPSLPEAERNKVAIGASALLLGLIIALAGIIYYRTKARGRILVPNN